MLNIYMDIDWDAVADTIRIMARMLGTEKAIKAIGTEEIIKIIGPEKSIQTIFPGLTQEQVKKLIELAKQLQSE